MTTKRPVDFLIPDASKVFPIMQQAIALVEKGIKEGAVLVTLGRPSRSRIQNDKFHAIISDIHKQCFRGYRVEDLKAILVNQFAKEMEAAETPLAHPGSTTWDWINQEHVTVRPSTTQFSKSEAAAFIEFLYAAGCEYGVQWSPIVTQIYDEYRQVQKEGVSA